MESAFAELLDAAPDGLMVLSDSGTIQYVNAAAARLLGSSAENLVDSEFGVPLIVDGAAEITIHRTSDGTIGICELRMSPAPWHGEKSYIVSLRDITALKDAERRAVEAAAIAELAEQAKTQLLWRTSHELRTPLSALVGFADLISRSEITEQQQQWLGHITTAGQHLKEVIDDVLITAEHTVGGIEVTPSAVPVVEAVREVAGLLQPSIEVLSSDLVLDIQVDAETCVQADPRRLRQVLLNLLSNAVKYNTDRGGVAVHIGHTNDDFVRVAISDHGNGLDEGQLARLFVAFDRLGAETSGVPGTGLGLVVAKAMTEAMGGRVGVASEAGEGSTFWIDLIRSEEVQVMP